MYFETSSFPMIHRERVNGQLKPSENSKFCSFRRTRRTMWCESIVYSPNQLSSSPQLKHSHLHLPLVLENMSLTTSIDPASFIQQRFSQSMRQEFTKAFSLAWYPFIFNVGFDHTDEESGVQSTIKISTPIIMEPRANFSTLTTEVSFHPACWCMPGEEGPKKSNP